MMNPFTGILVWACLSIMNPHQEVYGFAANAPFNSIVAAVTIGAWLFSREKKSLPHDALPWIMICFLAWMGFNSFFAADPDWSWPLWDRTWKIYVYSFLIMILMTTKARVQSLIWIFVISIAYYGVKGGLFTILTAGGGHVFGPDNTILSDNNHLAVAIASTLPMVVYLRTTSSHKLVRLGLAVTFAMESIAVMGSFSRGGMISLFCVLGMFWMRSSRKFLYLIVALVFLGSTLSMMPPSFFERMNTIKSADQDDSFLGRVHAWYVATMYATEHFPFGAGYSGPERHAIFHHYYPDDVAHAAHSIYFQVLGEHGFIGLGFYILIIIFAMRDCRIVVRQTKNQPEWAWAHELARMLEVSFVTFYIGASALSMAYYDGYMTTLALISGLREMTRPKRSSFIQKKPRGSRPAFQKPPEEPPSPAPLQPSV